MTIRADFGPSRVALAVAAAALLWAAGPAGAVDYAKVQQIAKANNITELRMTEAGGASGDSIEAGLHRAVPEGERDHGRAREPGGLGKLRAMVEAGAVTSVLLELGSPELEQAKALDLVEPLDWEAIKPEPIFPEAKDQYGFGYQYYSTIMAWRADAKAPANWQ